MREAPTHLDRWQLIAFRDRQEPSNDLVTQYEGRPCAIRDVRYALTRDDRPDHVGIMLFFKDIPGQFDKLDESEKNFFGSIGFLFLDMILGEYDVVMHVGSIDFHSQNHPLFDRPGGAKTRPLTRLADDFDDRLSHKIGPKPKGGWSVLASLGCPTEIIGKAGSKSPTSVIRDCDFNPPEDDDTPMALPASMRCGIIGEPPEDPMADMWRHLSGPFLNAKGRAPGAMESIVDLMYTPGLGQGIDRVKEIGLGWHRSVPIGKEVTVTGLKSGRTELNGETAEVISHIYDFMRIGIRVPSSGEELAIKPVNAELNHDFPKIQWEEKTISMTIPKVP